MKFKWLIVVCCLSSVAAGSAQQESSDKPLGANTVSGHVYCGDTNAPARMATVVLEPAKIVESISPGEEQHAVFSGEAVETLLDGSFVMQHVTPGTYYVIASQPGYVFPLAPLYVHGNTTSSSEDVSPMNILKSVPRISVEANLPVTVNVTIDRGAVVSGTVLYDDGSSGQWNSSVDANLPEGTMDFSSIEPYRENFLLRTIRRRGTLSYQRTPRRRLHARSDASHLQDDIQSRRSRRYQRFDERCVFTVDVLRRWYSAQGWNSLFGQNWRGEERPRHRDSSYQAAHCTRFYCLCP